jgi:hypothetical protein
MAIPFHCRCGTVQGEIEPGAVYARAVCYCRDCQAFARALGCEQEALDPNGGTDVVAMLPAGLRFTAGRGQVACLSLSSKGLLRWHSACCDTPIGNTSRNPRLPYVGVLASCMADVAALDAAIWPPRIALNTASALGEVAATPVRAAIGVVRIMSGVLRAKLSGRHRANPFFDAATSRPIAEPRVLTRQERADAEHP